MQQPFLVIQSSDITFWDIRITNFCFRGGICQHSNLSGAGSLHHIVTKGQDAKRVSKMQVVLCFVFYIQINVISMTLWHQSSESVICLLLAEEVVLSPGFAFEKTNLIERLEKHNHKFQVIDQWVNAHSVPLHCNLVSWPGMRCVDIFASLSTTELVLVVYTDLWELWFCQSHDVCAMMFVRQSFHWVQLSSAVSSLIIKHMLTRIL